MNRGSVEGWGPSCKFFDHNCNVTPAPSNWFQFQINKTMDLKFGIKLRRHEKLDEKKWFLNDVEAGRHFDKICEFDVELRTNENRRDNLRLG